jgi:hypothetical protein
MTTQGLSLQTIEPLASASGASALAAQGSNNAWYTILGAGIAATATLLAVALKFVFDARAEREKHTRELEKLRLQLAEARATALLENRRQLFVNVLTTTHTIYREIVLTRRRRRQGRIDDAKYVALLREISPTEAQASVEESRLIAGRDTCERADVLWHHLRSTDVPKGVQLASREWSEWKERYWMLRHDLVAACKTDLGIDRADADTPLPPEPDDD